VVYNHQSGFWLEPYVDAVPTPWAVNSANTVDAPCYVVLGTRVGYEYKPTHRQLFFEARNLTNATWVSGVAADDGNKQFFYPGDGRSFYGGISFSF
jgi:iron complex outermembrane recepter protein